MFADQHNSLIKGVMCAFCTKPAVRKCLVCGVYVCNTHVCNYPCKGVRDEHTEMFFLHAQRHGDLSDL